MYSTDEIIASMLQEARRLEEQNDGSFLAALILCAHFEEQNGKAFDHSIFKRYSQNDFDLAARCVERAKDTAVKAAESKAAALYDLVFSLIEQERKAAS